MKHFKLSLFGLFATLSLLLNPSYLAAQPMVVGWDFNNSTLNSNLGIAANGEVPISKVGGGSTFASSVQCDGGEAISNDWKPGDYLVTGSFSTAGYRNITVSFKQARFQYGPSGNFRLQYSFDNTNWVSIIESYTPPLNNNCAPFYEAEEVALPAAVSNKSNVYLRWYNINGRSGEGGGIRIENVFVKGISTACTINLNSISVVDASCMQNNASITINASCSSCGGSGIQYSIDNGATWQNSNSYSNLSPGEYRIRVKQGNEANCELPYFQNPVTVINSADITPPIITCPEDITKNVEPGQCGATASFTPAISDNCPGVSSYSSPSSGSFFEIGANIVTATATDASGNTDVCAFLVNIVDNIAPVISCPSDITTVVDPGQCGAAVSFAATTSDNCPGETLQYDIQPGSFFDVGSTTVTATVTDASGNTANCAFKVNVFDNIVPGVTCPDNIIASVDAGQCGAVVNYSVTASDNCPGVALQYSKAPGSFFSVGNHFISVVATDVRGNQRNCTFFVNVVDDIAPFISCPDDMTTAVELGQCGATVDFNTTASDNCMIQSLQSSDTSGTFFEVGNTPVYLTATDIHGNTSACSFTISVQDNENVTLFCKNPTVEIQPDGTYTLSQEDVFDEVKSTDNCGITTVSFPPTTFYCEDEGDTYPVMVSASDAAGNSSSCIAMVKVELGEELPSVWTRSTIGSSTSGSIFNFDPCSGLLPENGEFAITGSGNNATSSTTDNIAFVSQALCGDGSLTAKIESVDPNGYGGLMIRESTEASARQVAVFSNLTNILRHEVRYATNSPKQVSSFFKPNPVWLRLQRQDNWIFAYYSFDGINFQYVHGVMVSMQSCVEIGLASFTYLPNAQTEVVFSNVTISGSNGTLAIDDHEGHAINRIPPEPVNLSIYPNPSQGQFTLQLDQAASPGARVGIYNQYGQQVVQREIAEGSFQASFNLNDQPPGTYLLRMEADNRKPIVKVISVTR